MVTAPHRPVEPRPRVTFHTADGDTGIVLDPATVIVSTSADPAELVEFRISAVASLAVASSLQWLARREGPIAAARSMQPSLWVFEVRIDVPGARLPLWVVEATVTATEREPDARDAARRIGFDAANTLVDVVLEGRAAMPSTVPA